MERLKTTPFKDFFSVAAKKAIPLKATEAKKCAISITVMSCPR